MDILTGAGLAAPAGLNAYIPLLTVALLDRFTNLVTLGSPYDLLSSDAGLIALSILLVVELFADAIPGLDTVNDLIQTAIRPATGAVLMLAAGNSDDGWIDMHPILQGLLGAGLAGIVHTVKAVARPMVTVSTAGMGNAGVSSVENVAALGLSLLAVLVPILVLVGILIMLIFAIQWLVRRKRHPESSPPRSQ
ncbi:MAG: DUF4126 domain-containing protein [Sphaerobacteraceae bacterium]|nr:MAG: DUF4126 domain-containing protein [Sphaerobacteraceae bacterium]